MKIYIVRHGQSTHNANQDIPHNPDPPLTELGREQALLTAQALLSADVGAATLYSSPLRRALETAAPLSQAIGLPVHVHPDLCEAGGLREHAGMCRQDILDQWPGVTLDDRINEHGWWIPGESDDDEPVFYARAAQALSYLSNRHIDRQDTLVVVTHGRFGSALLSTILGTGPAGYSRYPFNNCGISRVDFDLHDQVAYAPPPVIIEEKTVLHAVRLRFHNDTSHLPAARRT